MIKIRKAIDRGHGNHGWLDTRHTFSFADYYDPAQMGFRTLRVINEDRVQPGQGFGMHSHRDMEIISYVLEGSLGHQDSMGNGSEIKPGELQRMSAGAGVQHSEFNPSKSDAVHFYQIWLLPVRKGLAPEYEQKRFEEKEKHGRLKLVAAPDGADGALTIHQDARIYLGVLPTAATLVHSLPPGRHAWLQVLHGQVALSRHNLVAGDGAALSDEQRLELASTHDSEVMLFDLA